MIDTRIISVPKNNNSNKSGNNTTNNIVTNQVVINSQSITADTGEFSTIEANKANIDNISSKNISAETINVTNQLDVDSIYAIDIDASNNIHTDSLSVDNNISADELNADNINTNTLGATSGTVQTLTSTTANITNLTGNTLTFEDGTFNDDLEVDGDCLIEGDATINGDLYGNYGEFQAFDSTNVYCNNLSVRGDGKFTKKVNNVNYTTTVEGNKIKLERQGSNTYTTIEYNKIDTPYLQAVNGTFDDTVITDNLEATNATIQDLLVTGTAHFYELMIDKIKSSEGQIILTSANAKIIDVYNRGNYYFCYFQAQDEDGNAIYNNFSEGDLVVCQNFNVNQGLSTNAHNKFYWAKVVDLIDDEPEIVTMDDDTDINCWWIKLSFASGDCASNCNGYPEAGDQIVQLGSVDETERQSAIIMSAYNNVYLDPSILSPSIVQYTGINDFNLSNHRYNVIAKSGNIFKGEFKTTTNVDIEDLIQNNSFVIKALYPTYSALVQAHPTGIQGEAYAVGTSASNTVYIWDVDSNSWKDIGTLQGPQGAQGPKGDTGDKGDKGDKGNKGDKGDKGDTGNQGAKGDKGDKGDTGDNAIEFVIDPIHEKADIDSSGNLDLKFGYDVLRIEGNTVSSLTLSTTGYYLIVEADSSYVPTGVELKHRLLNSSWTKGNYITNYYNVPTNQRPNGFYVYLVYQSDTNYVEGCQQRYVPVKYGAMAAIETKTATTANGQAIASIETRVTNSESTISGHTNQISQLQQTASGLTVTVNSHTSSINNLNGEVSDINDDISTLQVNQSAITTNVTNVTNKVDNLKVGSTQLLRGINKMGSLTTTAANATWEKGGWIVTSGGNGTGTQFTLTDSPNKLCQIGWRISNNTSGNRDFAQYKFPWIKGQEYTFSGYARAINGSGASLLIRCWDNTAGVARMTYTKTLSSGSWQYFSYTFTLSTETDITNSQFAFGLQGNCSAEFCCIKLEKGNLATDFSENPNDINSEISTLTTNVSEVQQTATAITSTVAQLQNQVNAIPLDKTVTVDASSLDTSKYYPVTIKFNYVGIQNCPTDYIRCKVCRTLDSSYGVPSYATHNGGFVIDLDWNTKAGGWGVNNITPTWSTSDTVRHINDYNVERVSSGLVVGSICQNTMQSTEIVYVRGGSKYDVSTSWSNSTIALNSNGYSWVSGNYSYSAGVLTSIVEPIKDTMSQSQIKQTASSITQTVTSTILEGDTKNLFYPACYNSDGMSDNKNEFFITDYDQGTQKATDMSCLNYRNYGKPIINSATEAEFRNGYEIYLYTPYVALNSSKTYTLTFNATLQNSCYLELIRYANVGNARTANGTRAALTSIQTLSTTSGTYTYNTNVISFTPSTTSNYYRLRFRLATGSGSANPKMVLSNISLYEGNISAGGFERWNQSVGKATSVIAQTADSIKLGVERAGINLTSGKITSIADNFEWKNNNNETILGINSEGDAVFAGTVKAKNFYHAISLAQWIQNNSSYPDWNVKYNVNGGLYIANKSDFEDDYNIHDLVPSSELALISTGDLIDLNDTEHFPTIISLYYQNYQMDGAVPCIGYADEAIFMTPTSVGGYKYVILPPATKCVGKIVTVYNKAYSNVSISVKSASSSDVVSPVAYYSSGTAYVSGNTGQTISLNNNQWIKFLALSNGWLAMANGTSTFT